MLNRPWLKKCSRQSSSTNSNSFFLIEFSLVTIWAPKLAILGSIKAYEELSIAVQPRFKLFVPNIVSISGLGIKPVSYTHLTLPTTTSV